MNTKLLREDFPTLRGDDVPAYLDNACVTLKTDCVIDAIAENYNKYQGCGGRCVNDLSIKQNCS